MDAPSFDIDLDKHEMRVYRRDGRSGVLRLPDDLFSEATNIRRFGLRAKTEVLLIELPDRSTATVELLAGRRRAELRRKRPIVYLDQNQWSKISAWRHGRPVSPEREADAAERLVALVEGGQLLVPASAGHFTETVPLYDTPRVELGSTVLSLSRGWHMRNPLHVRVQELIRALTDAPGGEEAPFGPGEDAFFSFGSGAPADVPPPFDLIHSELTSAMALHETIIDPAKIEDSGDVAAAAAASWAAGYAQLSATLRDHDVSREKARSVTNVYFLRDMADDLGRAGMALGIPPEEVAKRLLDRSDPLATMPFLSRMREILHLRVRNAGQSWSGNDLTDIVFLSCAAGYADVVIGERTAVGYLRQVRAVPPGAALATNLSEGLQALPGAT